jgi:hypothetical protein
MPNPSGFFMYWSFHTAKQRLGATRIRTPVSKDEAELFLRRFKDFFEHDGRHHVWIKSTLGPGLLVYDRHNVIYAYERLPEFEAVAVNRGLTKVGDIQLPFPHAHHCNAIFDEDERELLRYWAWANPH